MNRQAFVALLIGLAILAPACVTTRERPDTRIPDAPTDSAYGEGYSRGRMSGGWAGYRDLGKPHRRTFWADAQYARATEGYRPQYGSKFEYSRGFRDGYERGYHDRRSRERAARGR